MALSEPIIRRDRYRIPRHAYPQADGSWVFCKGWRFCRECKSQPRTVQPRPYVEDPLMKTRPTPDRIRWCFRQILGFTATELEPTARLREDLAIEPFEILFVITEIEDEFQIAIEDDAVDHMQTVGDMIAYVEAVLAERLAA